MKVIRKRNPQKVAPSIFESWDAIMNSPFFSILFLWLMVVVASTWQIGRKKLPLSWGEIQNPPTYNNPIVILPCFKPPPTWWKTSPNRFLCVFFLVLSHPPSRSVFGLLGASVQSGPSCPRQINIFVETKATLEGTRAWRGSSQDL